MTQPRKKRPPAPPARVIPGQTANTPPATPTPNEGEASVRITIGGSTRKGRFTCAVVLLLFGLLFWWKPIAGLVVVILIALLGFFVKVPGLR